MSGMKMTKRERFLLGIIGYLDDLNPWYLSQQLSMIQRLREEFGYERDVDSWDLDSRKIREIREEIREEFQEEFGLEPEL